MKYLQKLLPLEPNFGPFEDTGRVAIAEMVVTKTPDSRGEAPNINVPILKDDGMCEALPIDDKELIVLYLTVAMFLLL